jgi:hypothetical protein
MAANITPEAAWAKNRFPNLETVVGRQMWPTPCLPGNGGTNGKAKLKKMLWPTPRSQDREGLEAGMRRDSPGLGVMVRMWPTPDTCAGGTGPSQAKRNQPRLQDAVKMWATPNARDWKEQTLSLALARAHGNAEKSRQLPRQMSAECPELRGGKLNPMWVEWLMGWPLGWTDCAASATDKFRQWCDSHGKPSTGEASK